MCRRGTGAPRRGWGEVVPRCASPGCGYSMASTLSPKSEAEEEGNGGKIVPMRTEEC